MSLYHIIVAFPWLAIGNYFVLVFVFTVFATFNFTLTLLCTLLGELTHTTLHYTTPHHTTLHHTTPHHTTLHHTTPHHTTLHYTTPQHTTLQHTTPHYSTPHHTTPHHTIPLYTTPHHTIHISTNTTLHRTIHIIIVHLSTMAFFTHMIVTDPIPCPAPFRVLLVLKYPI